MTSRQETFTWSLILICATAFVFLTYVDKTYAQSSSRRGLDQGPPTNSVGVQSTQSTPELLALPTQTPAPLTATAPIAKPTPRYNDSTSARVAEANPIESPMTRQIRSQLSKKRTFQTGVRSAPNRSRALYNIRNERRQQDTQTVEELLEEMDRAPTGQLSPSTTDPGRPSDPRLPADNEMRNGGGSQPIEPAFDGQRSNETFGSTNNQLSPQTFMPVPRRTENKSGSVVRSSEQNSNSQNSNSSTHGLPTSGYNELGFFEMQAIRNHPTLNASLARILTARHEALQAGLHPNPSLGLFIDEAGNENDPGLWGAYLQRNHIRGNKLALGREIKNREATVLEVEFETQVIRIRTDVRTAFYRLLIAKEKLNLMYELSQTQQYAVEKSKQLFDAGETPRTDVLQTELQLQRTEVLIAQLESTFENAWRELTSVVGDPELEPRLVTGDLNPIVEQVSFEECRDHILSYSPELQSAQAEMDRIRCTIDREIAETIPDYQTQLRVGRDSTTNHFFTGLQVQIPLQICDQNQGNIAAAKSRLMAAQHDLERIKLDLSKRLAMEYRQYESALAKTNMYRNKLLPKSKQTLDLLQQGYPSEVSFLQLSTAQQAVIDITLEYLDTLNLVWKSRLKIEGLLLDNSLAK